MKDKSFFERHQKKTILVIVIAVIIIFDLIAGIFVVPSDNLVRSRHHYFHHTLVPEMNSLTAWGKKEDYRVITNSLGFRDSSIREVSLEKETKKRVLFIGDSFTEGIGIAYEKTFAGLLSDYLAPSGVEVLNAGVVSYSPKIYYLKTKYFIEKGLKFDKLVVLIDISDIQDEILYESFTPSGDSSFKAIYEGLKIYLRSRSAVVYKLHMAYKIQKQKKKDKRFKEEKIDPWLTFSWMDKVDSELYESEDFSHIRDEWTSEKYFSNEWTKKGLGLAKEHMTKLAELCKENNIEMTIAVYPWPYQVRKGYVNSVQVTEWQEFAEANGLGFVDLFPYFFIEGMTPFEVFTKYLIYGDIHWNEAGHRLVASRLLRAVSD